MFDAVPVKQAGAFSFGQFLLVLKCCYMTVEYVLAVPCQ